MITRPLLLKQIFTTFVLVALLSAAFFSFVVMLHSSNEQMIGDCPFSAMNVALCPSGVLNLIIHHISAYNSFFNLSISFYVITVVVSAGYLLLRPPPFLARLSNYPLVTSPSRKITRWLSLLENSPSR